MRASLSCRSVTAGLLALQLAMPAGMIAQTEANAAPMRLTGDARILQVLNRFTYGPRPGELKRVRAMGLNAWFQQQLNPGSIDDSVLEQKLVNYPAMSMPLSKLMELYPTGNIVRQAMQGRTGSPGGPAAKAIYADQMAAYKVKKDGKNAAPGPPPALPKTSDEIAAMPPGQRFKELCRLTLPQLRQLRSFMTPAQRDHLTDGMTPEQTEALAAFSGPKNVIQAEDIQVELLRDVYSERQLQEVMVDFWLNHFNVYISKSEEAPYYIAAYERNAIRRFALGNFETLLAATATSPAMLNYLDNASSIGPHSQYAARQRLQGQKQAVGLNENYARELMELHTVGVNGGYTQRDVTEVAKVFTGWTVGKQRGQDVDAQAQFDPTKHEPGPKLVMGQKVNENGSKEGFAVLHLLATRPQTARFISAKLAVRFVSDNPPPAMVERMTAAFLASQGDIRKVLLAMINSPEFFAAGSYRAKVKTPQEYVVSAVRAAGSDVESTASLADAIADLGMPLYGHQTPEGYSMKSEAWNNTGALVSRMNFALALSTDRVVGVSTDFNALLGGDGSNMTAEEKDNALENALLHVAVSPRTQELILGQTSVDGRQQEANLRRVAPVGGRRDPLAVREAQKRPPDPGKIDTQAAVASGLIFGSPEFQRF